MEDCFESYMGRIPYATLIATVMCLLGVGIFCGAEYRGTSLIIIMMDQKFHLRFSERIEAIQIALLIIGAVTAALGFMILFVGILATGETRHKVYREWVSRVGGRISCAVLIGLTYLLNFIWTLILCFLVICAFVCTIFSNMCSSVESFISCIDLTQFHFMFPHDTKLEEMKICGPHEIKAFCKDGVEPAETMFTLATFASLLVFLSLVHYLMCLSANYAHIRDNEN